MKKTIQIIALLVVTFGYAQQNFSKQVGKKDVKKGLISFKSFTNENGDVSYGFRKDSLIVGPNMILHADGKVTYQTYNKDNQLDGTVIKMDKEKDIVELYTYRDGKKDGPSFTLTNGKPTKSEQYKDDKIDLKGYVVEPPGKYALIKGDGKSGFTMDKYDNGSYALGYFKHGYRLFPMIHVWKDGDAYYGQYLYDKRRGFGVYFYNDGKKYIGDWDDNYKEGIGFMVDKNGTIIEKGYYEGGVLKTAM